MCERNLRFNSVRLAVIFLKFYREDRSDKNIGFKTYGIGGGSNGSRVRLWKIELQKLANELNYPIYISHFPPGTSKWNKIEHRLVSFISMNWRGKPLVSHETTVKLIAATTTRKGLKVRDELDLLLYPKGIKVADDELNAIQIERGDFRGEWNYSILPIRTSTAMLIIYNP